MPNRHVRGDSTTLTVPPQDPPLSKDPAEDGQRLRIARLEPGILASAMTDDDLTPFPKATEGHPKGGIHPG